MKKIYKFLLPDGHCRSMDHLIPKNSKILKVDTQDDVGYVWILLNPDAETVMTRLVSYGTGLGFLPEGDYIGTYQANGFVWHCWAEIE